MQFKCSCSDIYYLYETTGLEIRVGDLVIVEGDRGHDLGQVSHADVTWMENLASRCTMTREEVESSLQVIQHTAALSR